MTSGRSFLRVNVLLLNHWIKEFVDCRRAARGLVEMSDSEMDKSLADSPPSKISSLLKDVRRFFVDCLAREADGFAHSGTGYRRSKCLRSRFEYSLPLIKSSLSLTRSLRSRGFKANETVIRSSSLSIQARGSPISVLSFSYSKTEFRLFP